MIVELNKIKEASEFGGDNLQVDQIRAAENVFVAINTLKSKDLFPPNLTAVEETDVFRLRRGLCLPAASATCINHVVGFRMIGDEKGFLTLGDIYTCILPFHGDKKSELTKDLPQGWLVSTDQGDIYHQSIITFAKAIGIESQAVTGFGSVSDFKDNLEAGDALALSLDNNFVIEKTLSSNPSLVKIEADQKSVLIEGPSGVEFRRFENGRHVVAVTKSADKDSYTIHDSFRLPQMKPQDTLMDIDAATVDHYLQYKLGGKPRGILFSNQSHETVDHPSKADVIVPSEIVENIREYIVCKLNVYTQLKSSPAQ